MVKRMVAVVGLVAALAACSSDGAARLTDKTVSKPANVASANGGACVKGVPVSIVLDTATDGTARTPDELARELVQEDETYEVGSVSKEGVSILIHDAQGNTVVHGAAPGETGRWRVLMVSVCRDELAP